MSFSGGAVLFKDRNMTEEKKREALIEILTHPKTAISMLLLNDKGAVDKAEWVIIFIVDVPTTLSSKYFMNIDDNIEEPNVLLIKLLTNPDEEELTNEVAIHSKLGSQSTILPFCPSFIFDESIKSEDTQMTKLGNTFYSLLQNNYTFIEDLNGEKELILNVYNFLEKLATTDKKIIGLKEDLVRLIGGLDYIERIKSFLANSREETIIALITKIYALIQGFSRQTIILMEFIECFTLRQFYTNKRRTTRVMQPILYNFYNVTPATLSLYEFNNFCTYFLAALMAISGYSHGDLHDGNVMICEIVESGIVPYLIDFGKSTALSDLEFQPLDYKYDHTTPDIYELAYFDTKIVDMQMNSFIKTIYNDAKRKYTGGSVTLHTNIVTTIHENKYIEALILISMCKDRKTTHPSMFYDTFDSSKYKNNSDFISNYLYLYKITMNQVTKYNDLIIKIIDYRRTKQTMLDGIIPTKTHESKSAFSGMLNMFTSLTRPMSITDSNHKPSIVGGRHIINIIKNKSKKNKKKTRRNKTRRKKTKRNKTRTKK